MEFILEHLQSYIIVHSVLAFIGLFIFLINERYLRVVNIVWAILFGPFYFLSVVSDLDKIVIDLRNKK